MTFLQPPNWPRPKGYSNAILAEGKLLFLAGMIGWDEQEIFQSDCLVEQTRQTLLNILSLLKEAGAEAKHIVRMTWYITDKAEYKAKAKEIGKVYSELMGKHYPVMAMVEVKALIEDRAKVEIEATALIPTQEVFHA